MHFRLLQDFLKHGLHEVSDCIIKCPLPKGPVLSALVGPKIATTFLPQATARCMVPVSGVITKSDLLNNEIKSFRDVFPATDFALPSEYFSISDARVSSNFVPIIRKL